jgi:hypothetical protein
VYPILNNYFGDADEYTLYEKHLSESASLQNRITKTLCFPALADIIADEFYTGGKTIPETVGGLSAFAGQSFASWYNQVDAMFAEIDAFERTANG